MQLNCCKLYRYATLALFFVACCFGLYLLREDFSSVTRKLVYILGPITIFLGLKVKDQNFDCSKALDSFKPWLPWFAATIVFICAHGTSGLSKHLHAYILFILLYFGLWRFNVKRSLVVTVFALNVFLLSFGCIIDIFSDGLAKGTLGVNKNVLMPELAAISVCLFMFYYDNEEAVQSKSLIGFILVAIVTNMIAVVMSEVRTAVLVYLTAIPLLFLKINKSLLKKTLPAVVIACSVLVGLFIYTGRLQQGVKDLVLFQAGNSDTSFGIRLELWKLGLTAFADHPIFGWGKHAYESIIAAGYPAPVKIPPSHFHNEMVNLIVTGGLVSFLGWLATNILLLKQARNDLAAISLVVSFFVVGLSENSWGGNNTAFYVLGVSWLLLYLSAKNKTFDK